MGQGTRTLLDMTVWIMRRPEDDIAAELEASSGPLAGVRLAVKDNVDVGGVPTTAACPEYAYVPDQDATGVDYPTLLDAMVRTALARGTGLR